MFALYFHGDGIVLRFKLRENAITETEVLTKEDIEDVQELLLAEI